MLSQKGNSPLLSNSFFIFIIRFFPSLANLVVMVWYSRQLPPDAYGSYQHFWIQLALFFPIASLGIHVLIITYSRHFIASLVAGINPEGRVAYAAWLVIVSVAFALLQLTIGVP